MFLSTDHDQAISTKLRTSCNAVQIVFACCHHKINKYCCVWRKTTTISLYFSLVTVLENKTRTRPALKCLSFSQQCCQRFKSSGLSNYINQWLVTRVSKPLWAFKMSVLMYNQHWITSQTKWIFMNSITTVWPNQTFSSDFFTSVQQRIRYSSL